MRFLSSAKHHDLIETDGLWMFESKDANPIKLACQQTCACTDSGNRNHEHQHSLAGHPAIAVFQEHHLHPFVTVRPKLAVIRRIKIQERAGLRWYSALKCTTVDRRNSHLTGGCSSVRVEFDAGQVGTTVLGDLKQ